MWIALENILWIGVWIALQKVGVLKYPVCAYTCATKNAFLVAQVLSETSTCLLVRLRFRLCFYTCAIKMSHSPTEGNSIELLRHLRWQDIIVIGHITYF